MSHNRASGPWWSHRYLICALLALVVTAVIVVWTEVASCPECGGRLVVAATFESPGSHAQAELTYHEPSPGFFQFQNPTITVENTAPAPVAVAISDALSCASRIHPGHDIAHDAAFSEAAIVKTPEPAFADIVSAIHDPISVYYPNQADLPIDCKLNVVPTLVDFEARRLRFLHWVTVPPAARAATALVPSDSDSFYLDQPDADEVRIDDTTGLFRVTKPSLVALRNSLNYIPVGSEQRKNAVITVDWTTRQRSHWHELLLFIAAALVGVGATLVVEELRWWFSGGQKA